MMLSPEEWEAVRLTLAVAARAMRFGLPVAVLAAWVFDPVSLFPAGRVMNALVHLPMVLPPVVTGWLLLILFGVRGPIGLILDHWFGIRLVFTTAGASLACTTMTFPIMVRSVPLVARRRRRRTGAGGPHPGRRVAGPVIQHHSAACLTWNSGRRDCGLCDLSG